MSARRRTRMPLYQLHPVVTMMRMILVSLPLICACSWTKKNRKHHYFLLLRRIKQQQAQEAEDDSRNTEKSSWSFNQVMQPGRLLYSTYCFIAIWEPFIDKNNIHRNGDDCIIVHHRSQQLLFSVSAFFSYLYHTDCWWQCSECVACDVSAARRQENLKSQSIKVSTEQQTVFSLSN